ncbi:MAG: energy transducer TonB, partial [Pseudohongiella sp.]|nr:energy transducer TonB [Pseudohongiella sp.]
MKKNIIKLAGISFTGLFLAVSTQAFAQQPAANLAELLRNVEENRVLESTDAREREQRFQQQVNQQQQILEETRTAITQEEAENARLEGVFDANRQLLTERRAQLREVRANLNELLGTIQGVAGDFRGVFENSLISAQYPGRNEFLDNFIARVSSDTEQVRVDEIERFWFYMQQELVESGRVVKYQGTVGLPSGEQETRTITRIGSFNAIANGDYLSYTGAVGHLQVLPRQPSADVVGRATALENAQS